MRIHAIGTKVHIKMVSVLNVEATVDERQVLKNAFETSFKPVLPATDAANTTAEMTRLSTM